MTNVHIWINPTFEHNLVGTVILKKRERILYSTALINCVIINWWNELTPRNGIHNIYEIQGIMMEYQSRKYVK